MWMKFELECEKRGIAYSGYSKSGRVEYLWYRVGMVLYFGVSLWIFDIDWDDFSLPEGLVQCLWSASVSHSRIWWTWKYIMIVSVSICPVFRYKYSLFFFASIILKIFLHRWVIPTDADITSYRVNVPLSQIFIHSHCIISYIKTFRCNSYILIWLTRRAKFANAIKKITSIVSLKRYIKKKMCKLSERTNAFKQRLTSQPHCGVVKKVT